MEPEGLLPHSQEPVTCTFPEPDQSSPCSPSNFSSQLSLSLPSGFISIGFPTRIMHALLLSPYVLHVLLISLVYLELLIKFIIHT